MKWFFIVNIRRTLNTTFGQLCFMMEQIPYFCCSGKMSQRIVILVKWFCGTKVWFVEREGGRLRPLSDQGAKLWAWEEGRCGLPSDRTTVWPWCVVLNQSDQESVWMGSLLDGSLSWILRRSSASVSTANARRDRVVHQYARRRWWEDRNITPRKRPPARGNKDWPKRPLKCFHLIYLFARRRFKHLAVLNQHGLSLMHVLTAVKYQWIPRHISDLIIISSESRANQVGLYHVYSFQFLCLPILGDLQSVNVIDWSLHSIEYFQHRPGFSRWYPGHPRRGRLWTLATGAAVGSSPSRWIKASVIHVELNQRPPLIRFA